MNNLKNKWMKYALYEAEKGLRLDEVPIGAIIVKDNKIVGRGYNQVESLIDATAHAENIAITSAANSLGDWRLNDCSIYVTKEPCLMCYGAIINARIINIYYGFADKDNGFKNSINQSLIFERTHLKIIEGSILESECKGILLNFFESKRKKTKKKVK